MANSRYMRWRTTLAGQALPCAVVDLDAFENNARALLQRAGDLPIRVASKSIRCEALLRLILDFDPRFQGLMCFTAPEACWLSERGFDDLLVAYPTTQAAHIAQICRCIAQGKKLILTVDSVAHGEQIAAIAADHGVIVPVSIEMDMSLRLPGLNFGVWRSPVRDAAAVQALVQHINDNPHLRLAGAMGYEAQLAGVPDAAPSQALKNRVVRVLKHFSQRVITRRRAAMLAALPKDLDFINAGGTGCLEFSADLHGVTEVTAGSGFYCPHLFDGYQQFTHQPAAFFAVPVARKPAADMVTCLGGGYPASGASGADRLPQPWLPEGVQLSSLEATGEVQTPVYYSGSEMLELGSPVLFRHAKAGELCERFNSLLLVRDHHVVREVETYRGHGQCFL